MRALDRVLLDWRIRKIRRYLAKGASVLDVGCGTGAVSCRAPDLGRYVGIDPDLEASSQEGHNRFIRGLFPEDVPDGGLFDVILMLAVFEHVPPDQQAPVAQACARLLKAGGRVVMTVPSPKVDEILHLLIRMRLVDGMEVEQHHGYDARRTPDIFSAAGLTLVQWKRFQLGLNNLFVFQKV